MRGRSLKLQAWGFVWKSLLGVLIVVSLPLQALAGTGASSVLVTPANGAAVGPQSISFSWTAVPDVINYTVWIGTTPGAKNALYYSTASTTSPADTTSMTASLQPGTTYYVTVWTLTAAGYTTTASSFQTQSTSYLTAPKNGATVSPLTQFAWVSVPGAINYTLSVGTTPGAKDAFYYTTANSEDSGEITSTSANLQPGATYYATLSTLTSSGYAESTSTFQTSAMAYLTFPANGATNVNPFKPFTWTAVPSVQVYLLLVSPTGYSKWDNFASDFASTVTSGYVWALQPNTSYYATLCTQSNSGLVCSKSNFTTAEAQEPPSENTFYSNIESLTGQVRLMAPSPGNVPQAGSYLYQSMLDHNHPHTNYGASCGDFAIALAALLTENGVLARVRQSTLDGADVHVITEFWDMFNQKWQIADATFGVVYFDPNAGIGQGVEDVSSLLTSGNTSGITPIWVTSHGSSYMTGYYMDPISYYNNPYPYGNSEEEQLVYDNVPNSPLPLLNPFILGQSNSVSSAYMFYFANPGDQVTINNAGTSLTIKPTSAAGWAQTYFLYSGWSIVSPIPSGMQIFTPKGFQSLVANASVLTTPSSGATVSSQNIQFSWTSVPGVINYTLWIGTTPGAKDALYYTTAHAPDPTAITSTSASLQPGVTYYTTLWTLTSTGYTTTTSTFQTAYSSVLTAPANGATVSPRNIQFSWTAVPGVIDYTLWIGTTPGAQDALYYSTSSTSNPSGVTSMTASLQPSTTYYVTLWTLTSAGYITTTSTFSTGNTSYLTTPTNGATVAAQNIQFNWTLVPGDINYTLWVGTTPGAQDALYYTTAHTSNPGGITSTSASLQPGVTYYVTLWTLTAAGYTTANSTFQTASTTYLSAPANGATVSTMTQFTWLSAPGVINYTLWVG
ncbi:MAG TPA: hypothetical protein VHD85_16850, partial [Terracidiphilus sp.]|nr:hypothetical protein [Terracidiphilus sp.]